MTSNICGCTQIISNNIFLVGPYYNQAEKNEMTRMASIIETSGYTVYMPHRDGLDYNLVYNYFKSQNKTDKVAGNLASKLLYQYDVYNLSRSNCIIGNINYAVPDPTTVALLSIASISCIPVVLYKDDIRPFTCYSTIEPTLKALTNYEILTSLCDIVQVIENILNEKVCICISDGLNKVITAGSKIIKANYR